MRTPPLSPRQMAALGWERVDARPWRKLRALWVHREGWLAGHCGHPTANWPWALYDPLGRMHCVGLWVSGTKPTYGYAWRTLRDVAEYVEKMGGRAIVAMDREVRTAPATVRWAPDSLRVSNLLTHARATSSVPPRKPRRRPNARTTHDDQGAD